MITLEDCQAFCDADHAQIEHFARRECLPPIAACARAQAALAVPPLNGGAHPDCPVPPAMPGSTPRTA